MSVYGAKVYGSFKYGVVSTTDISVYPFTASSFNYGSISLSWVYPTANGDFSSFVVVRNPSGFPTTPDNGDIIYSTTKTALQTAGPGNTSVLGTVANLTDSGRFYSRTTGALTPTYSGTAATSIVNAATFSLTTTNANIQPGQLVSGYSGIIGNTSVKSVATVSGVSVITLDTNATIPAGTSVVFSPVGLTPGKTYYYSAFVFTNSSWVRVGTALGTSIKDYNTATVLYQSLPEVYSSALDVSSSQGSNQNTDLFNFLRTIAVEHDLIKTKVENAKNRYDVLNLDGKLIPALMDQMGFNYESSLGLQQARRMLNYADYIYLNKGTIRGLTQFVSSYSGYNASIAAIKNLFLTLDCASFESGTGFWSATGKNVSIASTTAAAEGGAPNPYYEYGSPNGYPNSSSGFLKLTATAGSSTYSINYAVSPDKVLMSNTFANNYANGYSYLTFATDTNHGFKTGQSVVIQGMSPNYVNGLWKIVETPTLRTFTVVNDSATTLISITPINSYGTVALYSP